jgi:hypothetical protein
LIIDALAHYAELTGIDLSKSPFAERFKHSNSLQAILELLEERERAFKEYRNRNRRLISCISPAVKVLHAFSEILGEAVSLVSNTCYPAKSYLYVALLRSPSHQQRLSLSGLILSSLYVHQTHTRRLIPM